MSPRQLAAARADFERWREGSRGYTGPSGAIIEGLAVWPGSHRGPLFEHWHDGVFTGAVTPSATM